MKQRGGSDSVGEALMLDILFILRA
jgi:hypothetical protein